MKKAYDIIIIGAGPGGLAAAKILAKHHKDVLLIEKNPVIGPKVCGGLLSAKIEKIGIQLNITDKQFARVKAFIKHKAYWVTSPEPYLAAMDRGRLGQVQLAQLASSTVELATHRLVSQVAADHITVDGEDIKFNYLIGADGSFSLVRKYLGIPTEKIGSTFQYRVPRLSSDMELYFDAHRFGSGYGWIVPHRDYSLIGAGQLTDELRGRSLNQVVDSWCREFNIDTAGGTPEAWVINIDYRGWQFGNIFLVGDAGGFTPGFSGEGIYFAMISGQEAAHKIIDPQYTCPAIKNILKKKFRQERFVRVLRPNQCLFNAVMRVAVAATKNKKISQLLIDFFLG